jgi:intracellular multiplication protein IcmB
MGKYVESFFDGIDTFFAWLSTSLHQTTEAYCEIETADSEDTLVAHDGSLLSIIKVEGVRGLVGNEEFNRLVEGMSNSLQTAMSRDGHAIQVYFVHEKQQVYTKIKNNYSSARATARRLNLELDDLFEERIKHLASYCADEHLYFVLWTRPTSLSREQLKMATKEKTRMLKETKSPPFKNTQTIFAAIPELRDSHDAFIRSVLNDFDSMNVSVKILEVHDAVHAIRNSADPDFTAPDWRATLPGDKIPIREFNAFEGDPSDLLWYPLSKKYDILQGI